ncbi:SLATT domain-containing protein [Actinobacillus equuli subsp. equuli]|uniref:SLATT domain-containing protein n=1 Tax=Actinobacillus equuli subsp. equuli TaxID=202947 RepID=A0A9X4G3I3_ACTEU|nr:MULTISPECIES: SLATT domain-containing protein [Actinobacillus]MDE8034761.1 SLATT domain-containing protein [Actinobacillus equuli subsp. equuli]MDG4948607.1 SLATT domain-containing protein [Actinobacillus equuli subsp. haemolyticus]WGE92013.1 SLATT domain-containing protein [Actinobacillus genomosp. 1]
MSKEIYKLQSILFMECCSCIKEKWRWLWSLDPIDKEGDCNDPVKRFLTGAKVTSVCRFNASLRIALVSKISFLTTTLFSLGLILIPLLQMILKNSVFSEQTLSVVQIFLAVSVLVYSTIISTAKYDVRAKELDKCGIDIKSIIRDIRAEPNKDNISLEKYSNKYDEIIKNCENHSRSDYKKAQLYLVEYFNITGIKRLYFRLNILFNELIPYIAPFILVGLEISFLLDMIGITKIFVTYFK